MSNDLRERAATFGLILNNVSLTHLTFGREFTEAVEAKQVAQKEAARARFVVEKAEQQEKTAIISAEGNSKAAELITNNLTNNLRERRDQAAQAGSCGGHRVPALTLSEHHLPAGGAVCAPPAAPARAHPDCTSADRLAHSPNDS
ncbi:Prohibitin [Plecturocebus cupreus]